VGVYLPKHGKGVHFLLIFFFLISSPALGEGGRIGGWMDGLLYRMVMADYGCIGEKKVFGKSEE